MTYCLTSLQLGVALTLFGALCAGMAGFFCYLIGLEQGQSQTFGAGMDVAYRHVAGALREILDGAGVPPVVRPMAPAGEAHD